MAFSLPDIADHITEKSRKRYITKSTRIEQIYTLYDRGPNEYELRALSFLPLVDLWDTSPEGQKIYKLLNKAQDEFDISGLDEAGRLLFEQATRQPDFSRRAQIQQHSESRNVKLDGSPCSDSYYFPQCELINLPRAQTSNSNYNVRPCNISSTADGYQRRYEHKAPQPTLRAPYHGDAQEPAISVPTTESTQHIINQKTRTPDLPVLTAPRTQSHQILPPGSMHRKPHRPNWSHYSEPSRFQTRIEGHQPPSQTMVPVYQRASSVNQVSHTPLAYNKTTAPGIYQPNYYDHSPNPHGNQPVNSNYYGQPGPQSDQGPSQSSGPPCYPPKNQAILYPSQPTLSPSIYQPPQLPYQHHQIIPQAYNVPTQQPSSSTKAAPQFSAHSHIQRPQSKALARQIAQASSPPNAPSSPVPTSSTIPVQTSLPPQNQLPVPTNSEEDVIQQILRRPYQSWQSQEPQSPQGAQTHRFPNTNSANSASDVMEGLEAIGTGNHNTLKRKRSSGQERGEEKGKRRRKE